MENYFFLENYVTSEGAVSHNVLYYQQLSIACYQVSFYANNYFESLPLVSSAFNELHVFDRVVHRLVTRTLIRSNGYEYTERILSRLRS